METAPPDRSMKNKRITSRSFRVKVGVSELGTMALSVIFQSFFNREPEPRTPRQSSALPRPVNPLGRFAVKDHGEPDLLGFLDGRIALRIVVGIGGVDHPLYGGGVWFRPAELADHESPAKYLNGIFSEPAGHSIGTRNIPEQRIKFRGRLGVLTLRLARRKTVQMGHGDALAIADAYRGGIDRSGVLGE